MTRRPPKPAAVRSARQGYAASNLESATIIAANPEKYQGVLQEWADRILTEAAAPSDSEVGPLFEVAGQRYGMRGGVRGTGVILSPLLSDIWVLYGDTPPSGGESSLGAQFWGKKRTKRG